MTKTMQARITGTGSYLPKRILSNQDLEKMVDTTDEWIESRTGIKERRIAATDETTSDMAIGAARKAVESAGISPEDLDIILVATATPDYLLPNTASLVQASLGAVNAGAVDLQAACTGYLYGLSMAKAYIESGLYRNVLIIASDKMSAVLDYEDRKTCILFGDGAAAAIVGTQGSGYAINGISLGADGQLANLITIPGGGSRLPASAATVAEKKHYVQMAGKEVFKHAVRRMSAAISQSLSHTGLRDDQISWLIPHQANARIIDVLAKNFQIPAERVAKTLHKYGNTSASSAAITMNELTAEKDIATGEHLLLVAFGAGLTWGALVLTKIEG